MFKNKKNGEILFHQKSASQILLILTVLTGSKEDYGQLYFLNCCQSPF